MEKRDGAGPGADKLNEESKTGYTLVAFSNTGAYCVCGVARRISDPLATTPNISILVMRTIPSGSRTVLACSPFLNDVVTTLQASLPYLALTRARRRATRESRCAYP